MSDLKKWFKVWASIIFDLNFQNMSLEDIGRWTFLGALMCQQGDNGKLKITPPAHMILLLFRVPTIDTLKTSLKRLPNVHLMEGISEDGSFIVLMRNWFKYQVDTTHTDRQKRARHKRRGEEKRSLTSTSTSSARHFATRPGLAPGASLAAREHPENGNGADTVLSETDMDEAEERERNLAWKQNTQKKLPESERMTSAEMKAIRLKNLGR